MALLTAEVIVPNARLTLEDLLVAVRGLDEPSRARVARVVAEAEMDARFRALIEDLSRKAPAEDISDSEIDAEVRAVRAAHRPR